MKLGYFNTLIVNRLMFIITWLTLKEDWIVNQYTNDINHLTINKGHINHESGAETGRNGTIRGLLTVFLQRLHHLVRLH
jgi:hypothetical protein